MSNLYTPSTGILHTYVTWEELEKSLQKTLSIDAHFGEKKHAEQTGHVNGFLSLIGVCDLDWHPADARLPPKILIKVASGLTAVVAMKSVGDVFTKEQKQEKLERLDQGVRVFIVKENAFYTRVTELSLSQELKVPRLYSSQMFSKTNTTSAFLAMEYFDGCSVYHIYDNLTQHQLNQVLRVTAKLQVAGTRTTLGDLEELRWKPFEVIYSRERPAIADLELMYQRLKILGPETTALVDQISEKIEDIFDNTIPHTINDQLGMKQVLVHGDLWSTNMLWKDGNLEAVVDWQIVHYGSAAEDIIRLLNSVLSGREREQHWEAILDRFYEYIEEELHGQPAPYTREQLHRAYRLLYPFATLVFIPPLAPIFAVATKDGAHPEKKDHLVEKVNAMLRSVLTFYEESNN